MPKIPERCRLVLCLDCDGGPLVLAAVAPLVTACDVASAIIAVSDNVDGPGIANLRRLVAHLQGADVAVLIADNHQLALELDADGVHLTQRSADAEEDAAAYQNARRALGDRKIVGVEFGAGRHGAMQVCEAGADYVAFPVPECLDDLLWWAEVVEVPAIAMGQLSSAEARRLAEAGVEFVAVAVNTDTRGAGTAVGLIDAAVRKIPLVSA